MREDRKKGPILIRGGYQAKLPEGRKAIDWRKVKLPRGGSAIQRSSAPRGGAK